MSHLRIPANWKVKRSTPFFTKENVPAAKVVINAGQFATSPPQYWHRVELSDDARFNIHFWVEEDHQGEEMYQQKKA